MSGVQVTTAGGPVNRGGTVLTTGQIGYLNFLRQTMLQPGETMRVRVNGQVKMEMLRERDALRIHAHIAHFMTPVRWLWPQWTDMIKEGPDTALTPPTIQAIPGRYGLGGNTGVEIQEYWSLNRDRIYNEWYKWPEHADISGGPFRAVNLEHSWTRCRDQAEPQNDSDKYVNAPADQFNIQDLAQVQARYQSAIRRDVFSFNRYQELLQDLWGQEGSREVDQVPVLLQSSQVGVNPRSLPASDAAGLGQWGSIYDFGVDDSFTVTAPEHVLLCTILVVRFAPIAEERNPLANPRLSWAELVGDNRLLAATPPQPVEIRDLLDGISTEQLGYLPAGWQWRSENNIIGEDIDVRDSFPYMKNPTNAAEARQANQRVNAFRSQQLGDYVADLYFNCKSTSMVPSELQSYTVGMEGSGASKQPYTKVRKVT
jgi:hypothetical protein